jgi:hypothetical protein
MELENINSNGDNVVASNLNNVNFSFLETMKIELKKNMYNFF